MDAKRLPVRAAAAALGPTPTSPPLAANSLFWPHPSAATPLKDALRPRALLLLFLTTALCPVGVEGAVEESAKRAGVAVRPLADTPTAGWARPPPPPTW